MPRSKTYTWRDGSRHGVAASVAGPEIERLAAGRGVEGITPEELVAAAKPKSSPLHPAFYKLSTVALAHQQRLQLARMMLNSLVVTVTIEDRPEVSYRPLVNLQDGEGYRGSVAVENDEDLRLRRVDIAMNYVRQARAILAEARGMADIVERLDAITALVAKRRKKAA